MTNYNSFINILNNRTSSMEICGIPRLILDHLLKYEPTALRSVQELRESINNL